MSQLLVSVRSAAEALSALAGGADLIDVKEPDRGSLGRAADLVVRQVVQTVGGARPVSAALGELAEFHQSDWPLLHGPSLAFVKWGLAGCQRSFPWRENLVDLGKHRSAPRIVYVAYADWECAQAPPLEEVVQEACQRQGNVLLVDTHCKDSSPSRLRRPATLLDWLSENAVGDLCNHCHATGVRVALAGSLGMREIAELLPAAPDWFAVRGAACGAGDRAGTIDVERVRDLAQLVQGIPSRQPAVPLANFGAK